MNIPNIASSVSTSNVYVGNAMAVLGGHGPIGLQQHQFVKGHNMTNRRLVRVIIVDPNENIPLDKSILFQGEEKFTDATDQELFFELEIRDMLEKHNEERTKIVDKLVKDRTQYLEPAKVRDLKMVVVNVAVF